MRTYFRIVLLVLIMATVAVGSSPVSAQQGGCTIQSSSLAYTTSQNYNYQYRGVIVPVSVSCSFVGAQLYAVGQATDTSTNSPLGSANVALNSAPGTTIYTGQLLFNLQSQVTGHTIQISISIYSGVYNAPYTAPTPVTTSTENAQVGSNNNYSHYANCYYSNSCANNYNSFSACASPYSSNQVQTQCVGYLYQDPNACVILVIPVYTYAAVVSYQYYTLQSLPSSYPGIGTWVTVTGTLNQGNNYSSTGGACPGNYLQVSSISTSPTQ